MGYTHRWQLRDYPTDQEWRSILRQTRKVLATAKARGLKVAREHDDPGHVPVVSRDEIRFNGVRDQGYETFRIHREDREVNYCKTGFEEGRAYDPVVVSVLYEIKSILRDKFTVTYAGRKVTASRFQISGPDVSDRKGGRRVVRCVLCGKQALISTAHRHQGEWIGDECCWDERLRASE